MKTHRLHLKDTMTRRLNSLATLAALTALILGACAPGSAADDGEEAEPRLAKLQQLTRGGQNAEAYFSADGKRLIYQATRPGEHQCDQIYTMNLDGSDKQLVSTGEGRTTCGYYYPSGEKILFSSTHHLDAECPTPPDRSQGYAWGIFDYDIFIANPDGSELRNLTNNDAYDAEATISEDGESIVFTSLRDGDLNIYSMDADGSNVRQLTDEPGYAGGPFYSPDGSQIVYRAHHPDDPEELEEYFDLLDQKLIRPNQVELFVMDADGSNKRQITNNGAANFAPYWHPNGRQIIFSSNMDDPTGRRFNLYLIDSDGQNLERITYHDGFDSFPMFSPDGTKLVFGSDRDTEDPREINVFIADWVEDVAN